MLREYYRLTKPGIVYGNDLMAIAGFFLGSQWHSSVGRFVAMLLGLSLVIASGCVANNCLDRKIDSHMARTRKRALVQGTISRRAAIIYSAVLGLTGLAILWTWTNGLTAAIALVGWVFYVVIYGIGKRRSEHGTLVGSISGAVPPVVGYTAATGRLDLGAWLLFIILVCWQMPHFYAIAMYRVSDYRAAGLPVLPVQRGMTITKRYIIAYMAAFLLACASLTLAGYTGYLYLLVVLAASGYWLWSAWSFKGDATAWGRRVFFLSLVVLLVLSVMISIDPMRRSTKGGFSVSQQTARP